MRKESVGSEWYSMFVFVMVGRVNPHEVATEKRLANVNVGAGLCRYTNVPF